MCFESVGFLAAVERNILYNRQCRLSRIGFSRAFFPKCWESLGYSNVGFLGVGLIYVLRSLSGREGINLAFFQCQQEVMHSDSRKDMYAHQACKLKFMLRELISCYCSVHTSHTALEADSRSRSGT